MNNHHSPVPTPGMIIPFPCVLCPGCLWGGDHSVTIVTHHVCYYWDQAPEVRGLVIPWPRRGNYGRLDYDAGAGQGSQCAKHCHCHLCYVKWFDLSYDYLSNFRGLISLGWKHLILLIQKSYASLFLCHALDLIYITLKYHFTMFNILIEMTWCPRPLWNVYTKSERPMSNVCRWRGERGLCHWVSAVRTPGTRIILKCDLTMYTALYNM